jgi:hypothetical protein
MRSSSVARLTSQTRLRRYQLSTFKRRKKLPKKSTQTRAEFHSLESKSQAQLTVPLKEEEKKMPKKSTQTRAEFHSLESKSHNVRDMNQVFALRTVWHNK